MKWISVKDRKPTCSENPILIIKHPFGIDDARFKKYWYLFVELAIYQYIDGREGFYRAYDPGDGWTNFAPYYPDEVEYWCEIPKYPQ